MGVFVVMAMGVCKVCSKYKQIDNEFKICKRCSSHSERHLPNKIKLIVNGLKIRLENTAGYTISKEDWFLIKRRVDNFYNSTSSDDIDSFNKDNLLKRRAEKDNGKKHSGYIYLIESSNGYYKIGRTIDLEHRLKSHERDYPLELRVIHSFYCEDNVMTETKLLRMFSSKKLQGEWFALEKDDVKFITSITDEIAIDLF